MELPDTTDTTGMNGTVTGAPGVVRQSTRAVFEAIRTAGDMPTVRTLYAQLGGSYPRLVQEVRMLREEAATGVPPLPDEHALDGDECSRVLLEVTPEVAAALEKLRQALREDKRLYPRLVAFLGQLQRDKKGPLTDVLAAWVRNDAP